MNPKKLPIALFVNSYKGTDEKAPDFKASIKIGNEYVSCGAGWKKESSKGTKFLSLSLDIDALLPEIKARLAMLTSAGTPIPDFIPDEQKKEDEFNNW